MFKAVDARTGAVLSEVSVTRASEFKDVLLGSRTSSGKYGPSANDGIIAAKNLPSDMAHTFVFRKSGYQDAEVIWTPGGLGEGDSLQFLSPVDPDKLSLTRLTESRTIEVPMYRSGDKGP